MGGIQAQRTRYNEFVESEFKDWALKRQRLMQALGNDRIGTKNTEVDGLTIRGNELLIRGYEFPSSLIHQEHERGIYAHSLPRSRKPPPPIGGDLLPYIFLFGPS